MRVVILALCLVLVEQGFCKPQTGYYASTSEAGEYIVNGQDVGKGRWPYMLSLEVFDPEFRHTCGATLLDSTHALTAAHCLDDRFPDMAFRVMVGASFRGDGENPSDHEQIVNIRAAVLHEDYNCPGCPGAYPNDIAVMYLEEEVIMNEFVAPARLASVDGNYTTKECYSSGWGKLNGADDGVPAQLQEIEIAVLTNDDCRELMPTDGSVQDGPHVCIFDSRDVLADEKRGICQGDSGGPLHCLNDDGEWDMLGAASWVIAGIGSTCNPAFPGVYADATTYLQWIQDKIDDSSWKL